MIQRTLLTAAALALLLAAPARAENAALTQDLKCLALSFTMLKSDDPKVADAGKTVAFYYLGRIDARDPSVDLVARFSDPAMQLSPDDMKAVATICAGQLSKRGQELNAASKELAARGF